MLKNIVVKNGVDRQGFTSKNNPERELGISKRLSLRLLIFLSKINPLIYCIKVKAVILERIPFLDPLKVFA